jgi:hypothetical protein
MKNIVLIVSVLFAATIATAQNNVAQGLIGKKQFGSHWIKPYGTATISKVKDAILIEGSQMNGSNFCKIKGKIQLIDDRNFEFNGTISLKYLFDPNNLLSEEKDEKVLTGKFTFRRIKDRKYWRLKQPESATGYFNHAYHYIDIFIN